MTEFFPIGGKAGIWSLPPVEPLITQEEMDTALQDTPLPTRQLTEAEKEELRHLLRTEFQKVDDKIKGR